MFNGGSDLYAWGFNMHGQVNGVPSQKPILEPKIVPFFAARKKVKLVAACRARSIAITEDNEVYEWGFTGSEGEQFQMLYTLTEEVVDVKLGLEFNIFLAKSGVVWISGAITQEGENVVDTYGGLINLSNRMSDKERVPFKRLECGYSHALLISNDDKVYVFGAGLYGQLGLGTEALKAKCPILLEDVNSGHDKVLMVTCGANFSLCYTTLGVVYYWGMLVPEDYSSITWLPSFLNVSYPRQRALMSGGIEEDILSWESFVLTDLKATFREIIACDVSGRIYHCDLNYNQTLKPYDQKRQALIGFGFKTQIGRSLHMFLESILSPKHCQLLQESFSLGDGEDGSEEEAPQFETLYS